MRLDALPINAFDVLLFVVLMFGLSRGRKHGMSEELLHMVQWCCIVVGCAFLYKPLGEFLEGSSPFSLLTSYVMVYLVLSLIIFIIFALLRRSIGGKLLGSDLFGKSEYYLGMISGAVRFACIAIACLAVLNARYFSQTEVRAMQRYQDDVYGSNFFPGLHSIQLTVFQQSLTGPWIRDNLGLFLIEPTKPADKAYHQRDYMLPE
jgi:uncharacterized membrane protein required for colicin V production